MEQDLDVRGGPSPRHGPYSFWLTGILVELGAFVAFSLVVAGMTVLLVLLFKG